MSERADTAGKAHDLGHTYGEGRSRYDLKCIWCGAHPQSRAAEKKCPVPARWESEG